MNSTQRRNELLEIMERRYLSLPENTKWDIAFHRTEVPMWLQIQRNIKRQLTERNDEKRLHVQMLESDPVIKFLWEMRNRVAELVSHNWEEVNGKDWFYDGGQSVSLQTETKQMFIDYIKWFITERKLDTFAMFWDIQDKNSYLAASEFWSLEELYNFLKELSQKSEEEISNFILNTLPGYSWNLPWLKLKSE